MFDNLKAWYKNRFQKPYGIDVIVVECGDLYYIKSSKNANSLFPGWWQHWTALVGSYDVKYIGTDLFFRKKEEAIEFAKQTYDKLVAEKKAKTVPTGKNVVFRAS
jgi:hypothetical protein